ncbi:MAG TPA: thiamine phosphate synthase [Thermoanaerobaculia bacterium]|nr:thiamine phosphate synthase [Thermoanaerobaculia bacterium]
MNGGRERTRPVPPALYAIADAAALGERPLPAAVGAMADAGVRWIQLRPKPRPPAPRFSDRRLHALHAESLAAIAGSAAVLWVDDRADLAALFAVAGLHLGQRDLPPAAARAVVGEGKWIGCSTHDEGELAAAVEDPEVDLVAVGPVYATGGKERPSPPVGLDFVRRARRATIKPLVAIGGIDESNLAAVLDAGADSVAVLGAACRGDVRASCERLLAAVEAAGA